MSSEEKRIKLYTKTGDKMKTSLYDGSRAYKEDYIFEVLGAIDELNCHIGVLAREVVETTELNVLQLRLTNIASVIATPMRNKTLRDITDEDISKLERRIDECQKKAPPLKEFLLPGGTASQCHAHLCRVHTRKVERMISRLFHNGGHSLNSGERMTPNKDLPNYKKKILVWFNRLSDFFFAYARTFLVEITVSGLEKQLAEMSV